jgi:uncharacterized damage-inducible protein DinB
MTFQDLETLLDFHYWARDRAFEAVGKLTPEQFTRDMGSSFRSVRDTLVHIYSSEWAWYQRWQGVSPTAMLSTDPFPDVASIREAWAGQEGLTRGYLKAQGEAGVDRVYTFTTLAGQTFSATFAQIVQHLANHGTYHRGQITTMLRQLGAEPAKSMDLIAYFRAQSRPKPEA